MFIISSIDGSITNYFDAERTHGNSDYFCDKKIALTRPSFRQS